MSERTPDEILDQLGRDLLAARPHRGRVQGGVLALAVLAIVVALSFTDAPPDREVAVTPTPTPTTVSAWPPPIPTPDPAARAKVLRATPVDIAPLLERKWVRDVVGSGGREMVRERFKLPPARHAPEVVGAWSVEDLKGEVLLVDDGTLRCLSTPDPLTDHPQIERGSTCAPSDRWISLGMGETWVGVVDPGTRAPVLRQPDGSREDLDGSSGLVVVEQAPGSRVTLFDARGNGRGDSGRGQTIPWSCGDGRRFDFDARRLPATDPCLEPEPTPRGQDRTRG
jgi:hypothetical protein